MYNKYNNSYDKRCNVLQKKYYWTHYLSVERYPDFSKRRMFLKRQEKKKGGEGEKGAGKG